MQHLNTNIIFCLKNIQRSLWSHKTFPLIASKCSNSKYFRQHSHFHWPTFYKHLRGEIWKSLKNVFNVNLRVRFLILFVKTQYSFSLIKTSFKPPCVFVPKAWYYSILIAGSFVKSSACLCPDFNNLSIWFQNWNGESSFILNTGCSSAIVKK